MENTLFTGGFPIETPISSGLTIATFDYRRVFPYCSDKYGASDKIYNMRNYPRHYLNPQKKIHHLPSGKLK